MKLNIKNKNIESIILTLSKPIERADVDLGFMTITDKDSGRSFMVDLDKYFIEGNTIECEIYDIEKMVDEYGIENMDSKFDLTLDDLMNSDIHVEAYMLFTPDHALLNAKLKVVDNGSEKELDIFPE